METTNGATPFGEVVLELMRERNIADAAELGLDRLDLRALRRHFDGENVTHRRWLAKHVAKALGASDEEMIKMAMAYLRWPVQTRNA